MDKNKFTPGPWRIEADDTIHTPISAGAKCIASVLYFDCGPGDPRSISAEEHTANTHLIRYAPDLFYHLQRMITCLGEHLEMETTEKGIPMKELCPCLGELKAAQRVIIKIRTAR